MNGDGWKMLSNWNKAKQTYSYYNLNMNFSGIVTFKTQYLVGYHLEDTEPAVSIPFLVINGAVVWPSVHTTSEASFTNISSMGDEIKLFVKISETKGF